MANRPDKKEETTNPSTGGAPETSNDSSAKQNIKIPPALEAALRLPTSYPLGANYQDNQIIEGVGNSTNFGIFRPAGGICVLDYVPTLGVSVGANSVLNRAAWLTFNAIRSQISGNRPYEPVDHMIYRACVDSMRDLYKYVKRIYKIMSKYSSTNLYKPRAILQAMGLNADNWMANSPDLYQWLLRNKGALEAFPTIPMGNVTARHDVFNEFLFTDGEPETSQIYIINQAVFWSYEVVDEVKGITPREFPSTYAGFLNLWDEMYNGLLHSSDVYIIAADIRRAFGDKILTQLEAPTADAQVEYKKLDPVLTSIMNASIIEINGGRTREEALKGFRIEDANSTLYCAPIVPGNSRYDDTLMSSGFFNHINTVSSNPTPYDILNSIRFKPVITVRESSSETQNLETVIESMGTEVIIGARITAIASIEDAEATYNDVFSSVMIVNSYDTVNEAQFRYLLSTLGYLSQFDWHPPVVVAAENTGDDGPSDWAGFFIEDIQNYVPISKAQLRMIHDQNLLAEFGLDQ